MQFWEKGNKTHYFTVIRISKILYVQYTFMLPISVTMTGNGN